MQKTSNMVTLCLNMRRVHDGMVLNVPPSRSKAITMVSENALWRHLAHIVVICLQPHCRVFSQLPASLTCDVFKLKCHLTNVVLAGAIPHCKWKDAKSLPPSGKREPALWPSQARRSRVWFTFARGLRRDRKMRFSTHTFFQFSYLLLPSFTVFFIISPTMVTDRAAQTAQPSSGPNRDMPWA